MEKLLENIWGIFVGLGWWMLNRMTLKIDSLEKERANKSSLNRCEQSLNDTERRVDSVEHTTVPRQEYKADIGALHERINQLEIAKEDKIQLIKILGNGGEKPKGSGK